MRTRVEIPLTVTAELTAYLAEWRQTHKAPTPLPKEVWSQAAALAAQYGAHPTARALGMGYATLRKHMAPMSSALASSCRSSAAFVEWLPAMSSVGECTLEVESGKGARLRVEVKSMTPTGLATILREFCQ